MTGLNHAATGVLVAVIVKQPAIALPAAFLSHFVSDAIPHFDHKDLIPKPNLYHVVVAIDLLLTAAFLTAMVMILKVAGWLIVACGLLAIAPDLMWLPVIIKARNVSFKGEGIMAKLKRFHKFVQWSEGPWGAYVEIFWLVLMLALILRIGR